MSRPLPRHLPPARSGARSYEAPGVGAQKPAAHGLPPLDPWKPGQRMRWEGGGGGPDSPQSRPSSLASPQRSPGGEATTSPRGALGAVVRPLKAPRRAQRERVGERTTTPGVLRARSSSFPSSPTSPQAPLEERREDCPPPPRWRAEVTSDLRCGGEEVPRGCHGGEE